MVNQQTGQENFDYNSSARMPPPARRFYAFADLPPNIQDNLRYLQNTEGDFLRVNDYKHIYTAVLLSLVVVCFFIFILGFAFSMTNIEMYFAVPIVGLLFLVWILYLARNIYKRMLMPIDNHLYLTPTQVIQTRNGIVRYRELKDASRIEMRSTSNKKSGISYALVLNFDDGDSYRYSRIGKWLTNPLGEANLWREKALAWRESAVKAFERGDAAYFNSHDTFRGLSQANTPTVKRKSDVLSLIVVLLITLLLPIAGFIAFGYVNKKVDETERWNYAASKNTVSSYLNYLKYSGRQHAAEANQKTNNFYDEATGKLNAARQNASDSAGVETALNLLANARVRQNNEVNAVIVDYSQKINREDFQQKISARFKEMFPDEVLFIKKSDLTGWSLELPDSSIKIEMRNPVEKVKPTAKKSNRVEPNNSPNIKAETKLDFKCVIIIPNKPDYSFELKSATDEDFINEMAKRFGV